MLAGNVLIADQDGPSRRHLRTTLSNYGFDVGEASSLEEIAKRLRLIEYDSVLLNINLGIEAIYCVRAQYSRIPVFVFADQASDAMQIKAFDAGADDVIIAPGKTPLLMARLRSGIRRFHAVDVVPDRITTGGDITLDPIRRRVEKRGILVNLRPQEFCMLKLLMENAGKVLTHSEIFHSMWGTETGGNRARLRVHIRELRKKLEPNPSKPRYILTDNRVGYRFESK
jgi:two-component system, OmpR family, KDP operon response regulator KdpE